MKLAYAVRRRKTLGSKKYVAWLPVSGLGYGASKTEALRDLKKQFKANIALLNAEVGETDLEL